MTGLISEVYGGGKYSCRFFFRSSLDTLLNRGIIKGKRGLYDSDIYSDK